MSFFRALGTLTLLSVSALAATPARAGSFDARGFFSFDKQAVITESFETSSWDGTAGDSSAVAKASAHALDGKRVLSVDLKTDGYPIALLVPAGRGSYRLRYWVQGDCEGGLAVDYAEGTRSTTSRAFPTGRVTSDGWLEMETEPVSVDGTAQGVNARMFLSAYDANTPTSVEVDAVELVPDGSYEGPRTCVGLDEADDCGPGRVCLGGECRDARGWYPPLPDTAERTKVVAYWKQKLHDTFGPYALRHTTLSSAEASLDKMSTASDNVDFWSRFTEAIRRLSDAHTYARPALSDVKPRRPLDACFFEGDADASQNATPSQSGLPDILVSHTGPDHTWGLKQGDRLVAVDGEHPLTWARKLIGTSPWYWEADDPDQIANIMSLLRDVIVRHAKSITVVHCDASQGTCDDKTDTIELSSIKEVDAADSPALVGCDNRPFYEVAGAPADHRFGNGFYDPAIIVEGQVLDTTNAEEIQGLIWNTLLGGTSQNDPVTQALDSAVQAFQQARGVLLDHREGHGGDAPTANILISFARKPYTPFIGYVRTRANDEGPSDAAAGADLFNRYQSQNDVFGSNKAHTDVPVALLTTWDVSASDYLPKIMKGGPKVRLFGPGPSMGAFGTFMQYSEWGVLRWSIGIEDAIAPDGTTLCTHGVDPDVVVKPKQSDLLAGRDTVVQTALAWVRTELP